MSAHGEEQAGELSGEASEGATATEGTHAAEEEKPVPENCAEPHRALAAEEEEPAPQSEEEPDDASSVEEEQDKSAPESDEESHQAKCGEDSLEEPSTPTSGIAESESPSDSSSGSGSSEDAENASTGDGAVHSRGLTSERDVGDSCDIAEPNAAIAPWASMRRRKRRLAEIGASDVFRGNNGCTSDSVNGVLSTSSLDTLPKEKLQPLQLTESNLQILEAAEGNTQSEDAEAAERWKAWRWAHLRNSASDDFLGVAEPATAAAALDEAPEESSSSSSSDSPVHRVQKAPRRRACAKILAKTGLRCSCHMAYVQFCPARPGFEELKY